MKFILGCYIDGAIKRRDLKLMFKRDNLDNHKAIALVLSMCLLIAILAGCAQTTSDNPATTPTTAGNGSATETTGTTGGDSAAASAISVKWTDEDQNTAWDAASAAAITLLGSAITAAASVTVDGKIGRASCRERV